MITQWGRRDRRGMRQRFFDVIGPIWKWFSFEGEKAVRVSCQRIACSTSSGKQTLTNPENFVVAAYIIRLFRSSVNDTETANAAMSIGFADETTQFCTSGSAEDNVATSNTKKRISDTKIVVVTNPANGAEEASAAHSSFSGNDIVIDWSTNNPATAYFMLVTFFGGSELSVHVELTQPNTTEDATVTVTTGFQTALAYFLYPKAPFPENGNAFVLSYGAMSYDGTTISQGGIAWRDRHARATAEVEALFFHDGVSVRCVGGQSITKEHFEVTSVTGTTVVVATRESTATTGHKLGGLYLGFGASKQKAKVVLHTSPSSTGNQSFVGVGFKPGYMEQILSNIPTRFVVESDADAGYLGFSVADGTREFCGWITEDDNNTTMDNATLVVDKQVRAVTDDGTVTHTGTFVGFQPNGHITNFSNSDGGSLHNWVTVYIQEVIVAAVRRQILRRRHR